jgi:Ser/Thr protein kinase RdoA (MazF antagonist)
MPDRASTKVIHMIDRSVSELLCEEFELGHFSSSEELSGTRNHNFVLHTSSGRWFARLRHSGYSQPERIRFDHEATRYLAERGVPVVPPRPKGTGATHTRHAGNIWEIFPFVEGSAFREGDVEHVAFVGASLAEFHRVGRGFPLRCDKIGVRGETDLTTMRGLAREIVSESPECAEALTRYLDWIREAERELPDISYESLSHTLVHGDIQPANILMAEGRVAAFVDLDWCAWRPATYDLGFAVVFCCSTHATPIRGDDIWSLSQPLQVDLELVRISSMPMSRSSVYSPWKTGRRSRSRVC